MYKVEYTLIDVLVDAVEPEPADWTVQPAAGGVPEQARRLRGQHVRHSPLHKGTVQPKILYVQEVVSLFNSNSLYKMGHYFFDT